MTASGNAGNKALQARIFYVALQILACLYLVLGVIEISEGGYCRYRVYYSEKDVLQWKCKYDTYEITTDDGCNAASVTLIEQKKVICIYGKCGIGCIDGPKENEVKCSMNCQLCEGIFGGEESARSCSKPAGRKGQPECEDKDNRKN